MSTSAALQPGLTPGSQVDRFIVVTALASSVLLGLLIWLETAPFMVALFAIGTILGIALYHGAFGFTAGCQTEAGSETWNMPTVVPESWPRWRSFWR